MKCRPCACRRPASRYSPPAECHTSCVLPSRLQSDRMPAVVSTEPLIQREPQPVPGLHPISLPSDRLWGRNCLLGNKQGFMLHLPAANGAGPRTIHRSKWFGASRFGRKFVEAVICRDSDGNMLSRKSQTGFMTDGMVAERSYGPVTEQYFVPDHLTALRWTIRSPTPVTAEVLINMRFQRGVDEEHGY